MAKQKKYRISPCTCADCEGGRTAMMQVWEDDKVVFGVCIEHGKMQLLVGGVWSTHGPIIRTEEDLFNAFAAMTQKRLKADTDG